MSDFEQKSEEITALSEGTFGAWLKAQRQAKKVSLEEIAAVTKIHLHQLRGLEEGWSGDMPALAFVRGFTMNYSKHLGLNEAEVLEQFHRHSREFVKESTTVKSPPPQTYTSNSGKPLRFGSYSERRDQLKISHWVSTKRATYLFLVLLGIALVIFLTRLGRRANDAPSAADQSGPQPEMAQVVDKTNNAGDTLFAGNPPFDIVLVGAGDVWVNIKTDENSLENIKLTKEQSKKLSFNRKLKLTISDPNLLRFGIAGKNYKMVTGSGTDVTLLLPDHSSKLLSSTDRPVPSQPPAATGASVAPLPPSPNAAINSPATSADR